MQRILGPVAERAARATGVVQRAATLPGARLVQTLVCGWLAQPGALVAGGAHGGDAGRGRSPQAVDARCSAASAACLRAVVEEAVPVVLRGGPRGRPRPAPLHGGGGPGRHDHQLAAAWRRSGRVWRQHPAERLRRRATQGALRSGQRALARPLSRSGAGQRPADHRGDPAAAARGRAPCQSGLVPPRSGGRAQTPGRLLPVALAPRHGPPHAGRAAARAAGAARRRQHPRVDQPVLLGARQRLPARLLAVRVPQDGADQPAAACGRRRARRGGPVSAARLARCAWTVRVTTAPPPT